MLYVLTNRVPVKGGKAMRRQITHRVFKQHKEYHARIMPEGCCVRYSVTE